MTYVAQYYMYFSRARSTYVHAKRVGRVLDDQLKLADLMDKYEFNAGDLAAWIERQILKLNDRQFPNTLPDVQNLLATFNAYLHTEKPPKYVAIPLPFPSPYSPSSSGLISHIGGSISGPFPQPLFPLEISNDFAS